MLGLTFFLSLLLCGFGLTLRGSGIIVSSEGQPPIPVYHALQAHKHEKLAARELAKYLAEISGKEFSASAVPDPLPDRGIFVGDVGTQRSGEMAPDDFEFASEGQRLYILGGSPRGTLYAVYDLLEQELGCRWWSRNEEFVPEIQDEIILEDVDRMVSCDFSIYDVWNREAQSPENRFVYKARTKGSAFFSGGHSLYPLLKEYGREHPEIYPMNKEGERKPNNLHFCYLAPGIADALAGALEKEVEKRGGRTRDVIYFAGMGDWYGGMCRCEKCKSVYREETWTDPDGREKPGYSASLLKMINRTGEILETKYPGIRVGTFAYMSLEAPPAGTVPGDNVVIRVPRLRHCTVHAIGECDSNRSFLRNLERWCELAPGRVYVWDYGANFGKNFMYPFPCLLSISRNIQRYREIGVRGVEIQGNYVSHGGDLAVLKNYVWRNVFWNPQADPRNVLAEFSRGYYGAAGDAIMAYVDILENAVRKPERICADEFAGFPYLTADVLGSMRRKRNDALAAAESSPVLRGRVLEATAGLEAYALWKPGPLAEQGNRLIREDLGGYTYDRALALLESIREASPREWGLGRPYHLNFLSWHGGPLPRLQRNELAVSIAPALNGRIRQIYFRDKPLLYVEQDSGAKGYPHLGGSVIRADTRTMTWLEKDSGANKVVMEGDAGIGMWSISTKQKIRTTVMLDEDGAIVMEAKAEKQSGGSSRNATVVTTYPLPGDLDTLTVSLLDRDNRWQPLHLSPDEMSKLENVRALRIGFAEKECRIDDYYLDHPEATAEILMDTKAATLTTTVRTPAVELPDKNEVTFLKRKLRIQPLEL